MRNFKRLASDERGISLIWVGAGFMAFLAATSLALDVGMLMTARNEAQNTADAAALAGATALAFNNDTNFTSSGPAVQNVLAAAVAPSNLVIGQPVSVTAGDVQFLNDPSGQPNWVNVTVYRTQARGNAVPTLIGKYFGIPTANIAASATASAELSNAETCVKPWAIPDKWIERQTPPWSPTVTFNAFPTNPSVFPDVYRDETTTSYTGFTVASNVGLQLSLNPIVSNTIESDMFIPLQLPGSSGEADYRNNILNCNTGTLTFGSSLTIEPTATAGDAAQEAQALINLDPSSYWDAETDQVVSPNGPSPRVIALPVYNPYYFQQGFRSNNFTQLEVSNFVGFFIESVQGSSIVGVVVPLAGEITQSAGTAPIMGFPKTVQLVQ